MQENYLSKPIGTRDVYLRIVKKKFPNVESQKIQIYDDGWDYMVIVVNSRLAFRFPRREDYAKTLPIEVSFLDQFANESPIKVPRLIYQKDEETEIPYVVYDFIPGVQFTKGISQTFSREELLTVAQKLGIFLTAVHTFSIGKARQLGIPIVDSLDSWQKRLTKIKNRVFPNISEDEQQWVVTLFENFFKTIRIVPVKPVLTHSDIMPEHIIVDPMAHVLSGIIDFGDMCIADPAYDFTFLSRYGKDFLNEVYKNYSLTRDDLFEVRRQFYEDRLVVTNLEHSLELRDEKRIEVHKKQLSDYVKIHR